MRSLVPIVCVAKPTIDASRFSKSAAASRSAPWRHSSLPALLSSPESHLASCRVLVAGTLGSTGRPCGHQEIFINAERPVIRSHRGNSFSQGCATPAHTHHIWGSTNEALMYPSATTRALDRTFGRRNILRAQYVSLALLTIIQKAIKS